MVDVAAVLEAEPLVVRANPGIVALAVEAQEAPSGGGSLRGGPLDERGANAATGESTPNRKLVQVGGVGRPVAPERRVVPEHGERRCDLAVHFRNVELAAFDPHRQL